MSSTEVRPKFYPGQRVIVHPDQNDRSPAWAGTIINYWRNGAWTVQEPEYGSTCAYPEQRLTAVLVRLCTECGVDVEVQSRPVRSEWWRSEPVCPAGHDIDLEAS